MELTHLTLVEASQGLKDKLFSVTDLVQAFLQRIEKLDTKINSYLTVFADQALAEAKLLDAKDIKAVVSQYPLAGLPLSIKDNILIEGRVTTAGSKMLEHYTATYSATVVNHLLNSKAIILGKNNLDEFAMGSSTETSAFGPTKNPWDLRKVPGGTSGGSAAAVAADLTLASLGSDTGGSIRQPASFCGCVGYKPTYGAVSRYGLMAMASSFDQIGPLAKTVADAAWLTDAVSGRDIHDATTNDRQLHLFNSLKQFNIKGLTIGLPQEYFTKDLDRDLVSLLKNHISKLEQAGAIIKEISLPLTKYNLPVYYIIMPAEASTNLGRYDGLRYGFSDRSGKSLDSVYVNTKSQGFGAEVRRRILLGTYALSSGYYDAYYGRAQKVRSLIKQEFDNVFAKVDFILTPTAPTPAFALGAKIDNPIEMYLQDIFTVSANVAGLPAISIPAGLVQNLPVGLQILGRQFDDEKVMGLANTLEGMIGFERLRYAV